MFDVAFIDRGPYKGRTRERLLALDGVELRARRRFVFFRGRRVKAFVIVGREVRAFLPNRASAELGAFSRFVSVFREGSARAETAAYKHFVTQLQQETSGVWRSRAGVTAWHYGPVPVVALGLVGQIAVFSTPIPGDPQAGLFASSFDLDLALLEALRRNLRLTFEEYFSDIADLFRSGFFRADRRQALGTTRLISRILSGSINAKLDIFFDDKRNRTLSEAARQLRDEILRDQEHILRTYRAAAQLVSAMVDALRWIGGEDPDYQAKLAVAHEAISALADEPANADLLRSIESLQSPKPNHSLAPLISPLGEVGWKGDLFIAARFMSQLLDLLQEGRDQLFIFVTHHMDVYASEFFYDQLRAASRDAKFQVWSGDGRQEHILLRILAKLWLSDVQIIFVPNSFDCRSGRRKNLGKSQDWVVEETFYGRAISKEVKFIFARGADDSSSSQRAEFIRQLKDYEWHSLHKLLRSDDAVEIGKAIHPSIIEHLRVRSYDTFSVTRQGFSEADKRWLQRGVLVEAVRKRVWDRLLGLRLSVVFDHWVIARALYRASRIECKDESFGAVSRARILKELRDVKRSDGLPINERWVQKALCRLTTLKLRVEDRIFPFAVEGARVDKRKTYRFALQDFVDYAFEYYQPVSREAVDDLLERVMTTPFIDGYDRDRTAGKDQRAH